MNKKKAFFFAAADINNFPYGVMFWNSMTKFHSPQDIDMVFYTNEKRPDQLKRIPKGIRIEDVAPYLRDDPMFWYRQKPILAEPFMDRYELVCGFDVDQIVTGSLDYIINVADYDIGTVINWNRSDPQFFGFVQFQGVQPMEYFNCGLVAMRNKRFVHDWKVLCFTPQFDRNQYKEQDLLNAMCYYGNWNIRCFDHGDGVAKYNAWHGLISKGELSRAVMREKEIIVPKGFGDTPFPPTDMVIKVIHAGGGNQANKMNYHTWVSEEVAKRLDYLVGGIK